MTLPTQSRPVNRNLLLTSGAPSAVQVFDALSMLTTSAPEVSGCQGTCAASGTACAQTCQGYRSYSFPYDGGYCRSRYGSTAPLCCLCLN